MKHDYDNREEQLEEVQPDETESPHDKLMKLYEKMILKVDRLIQEKKRTTN